MNSRLGRPAVVACVALLLVACTTATAVPLPTDARWKGGCRGVGTDLIIHGSATDPQVTWATRPDDGQRVEILWPVGYSARFVPQLEVLDATGKVIAHDGDWLTGGCGAGEQPAPRPPIWVDETDVGPAPSPT